MRLKFISAIAAPAVRARAEVRHIRRAVILKSQVYVIVGRGMAV
jgi:hypothetical protein